MSLLIAAQLSRVARTRTAAKCARAPLLWVGASVRRWGTVAVVAWITAAAAVVPQALASTYGSVSHAGSRSRVSLAGPTISPLPGTPDASPTTQISVLGVAPARITHVSVIGSTSGAHSGQLRDYSGRQGASFVLSQPLSQGESVHVSVGLRGEPAASTHFTVAHLAPIPPAISANVPQLDKLDRFVSAPLLLPPKISVLKRGDSAAGDIFLTPLPSPEIHPGSNNELTIHPVGPGGAMIINSQGHLVWFDQMTPPVAAANFRVQRFGGHEVLTWWQGRVTIAAFGLGEGVIMGARYQPIRVVQAGNGYQADIHEFLLTPGGDALFTVYSPVLLHVPGTPAGKLTTLLDSLVQEVDVRTGLVVWEWHSLGHVPLADSYASPATSAYFDAFHLNSIQVLPEQRLLVSARDTSALYKIDQHTGRVLWTLGGKASSFHLGRGARFYFQHDAVLHPGNVVSLFDDGAGPPFYERFSRGLVLGLDLHRHTATVVHAYHRPGPPTLANSQGSVQTLPNGNVFVGFGSNEHFSEFSSNGRLVFDAALPVDDGSYRVFRFPWQTTPLTQPAVAARRESAAQVAVYASWNGATTVARWQVLAGTTTGPLRPVATVPDRNFETEITVNGTAARFAVRALDAKGRVLRQSLPVSAP